jgi:hypothetical protein
MATIGSRNMYERKNWLSEVAENKTCGRKTTARNMYNIKYCQT